MYFQYPVIEIHFYVYAVVFADDSNVPRGCQRPRVAGPPKPHSPAEGQAHPPIVVIT